MPIKPDEILAVELANIARAAYSASKDRAKVTTCYLLTLGTLAAGFLASEATLKPPSSKTSRHVPTPCSSDGK